MAHKLLLADDSVTIQRVIELTFADEDIDVVTAGDGEQAIACIQAERPDIVLADVGMPKRSGYDVAAFVKGVPELSHIPVLLLTGAFEPVDERRAQAAGCDGVLVKPFEPQHVIARVRELLQNVPGGAAAPPAGSVTRAVADVPRPAERLAPHRPQAARPGTPHGRDLDDYFDRLDAAFANMADAAETPAARPSEAPPRREGPVMERDLDWFDPPPPPEAASARPASPSSPPIEAQPPAVFPVEQPAPARAPLPVEAAPSAPSFAGAGSAIADAFSALLAAEQGDPDAPPVRLPVPSTPPAITDDVLDEITRRIVDRLGSHAVHDLVEELVSRVAERLVREEIERIRARYS